MRQELIERKTDVYWFAHDRVQEAAYSLIPEERRAEAHLRIGRLLLARTPEDEREEAIFEIVGQLNRGAELIASQEQRDELAGLNLIAGKRAKSSAAYASALAYFAAGARLLGGPTWRKTGDPETERRRGRLTPNHREFGRRIRSSRFAAERPRVLLHRAVRDPGLYVDSVPAVACVERPCAASPCHHH